MDNAMLLLHLEPVLETTVVKASCHTASGCRGVCIDLTTLLSSYLLSTQLASWV